MNKITLIVHMFMPESSAGTEVLTYNIAKNLKENGYQVSIISTYQNNEAEEGTLHKEIYKDLTVYKISYKKSLFTNIIQRDLESPKVGHALERLLSDLKPNIIQFTHLKYLSAYSIEIALKVCDKVFLYSTDFWFACPRTTLFHHNKKIICDNKTIKAHDCISCLLGVEIPTSGFKSIGLIGNQIKLFPFTLPQIIEKRTNEIVKSYNKLSGIIAPNQFMKTKLIESGVNNALISVVPFGQDSINYKKAVGTTTTTTTTTTNEIIIAFIGSIIPEKGPHIFINTAKQIFNNKIIFKLYGNINNSTNYSKTITQESTKLTNLQVCGSFKQENFDDILREIDIIIIPSIWHENSPLVGIKSALAGKWLIMSNVSGLNSISEYTDKSIYFEPGNAYDCTSKILTLISDWEINKNRVNSKSKNNYSTKEMVNNLILLYQGATNSET